MAEAIKVVCRFRGGQQSGQDWQFPKDNKSLKAPALIKSNTGKTFTFDRVLDEDVNQEVMYEHCAKDTVKKLMQGFNGTIFAYGQSGSGKTFSMLGPDDVVQVIKGGVENKPVPEAVQKLFGIIPRAVFDIFTEVNRLVELGS